MSLNEEFDELARRKLEERQFSYQEADWQDAQKLIDAQRGRRGRTGWILSSGLLLLISGLIWQGTRSTTSETVKAVMGQTDIHGSPGTSQVVTGTSTTTIPSAPTTPIPIAEVQGTKKLPTPPTVAASEVLHASSNGRATTLEVTSHKTTEANGPGTVLAVHSATARGTNALPVNIPSASHHAAMAETTPERDPEPVAQKADQTAASNVRTETPASLGTDRSRSRMRPPEISPNIGGKDLAAADAGNLTSTALQQPSAKPMEGSYNDDTMQDNGTRDPASAVVKEAVTETTPRTIDEPGKEGPPADAISSNSDSASTVTDARTAAGDLSTGAVPPPAAEPPLVPERAPWEISALGGIFSSKSGYSGSNSADWTSDISREHSIGLGVEVMHMGRNIGIGAGLHYGSYAERIRTGAVDQSSMSYQNFWYLMPLDTTILFISDTVQQGGLYTGISVDTTIDVLAQGTDTTTTSERLREARDQMNHVSYLEIPLLLDAHLVQGRWNLGLRGGPTIGLLTGHRGSVPNATEDGYLAFTDQPFREVVFGYTVRAYVRYRFNAGWSVGIEPMMRGQLLNSLSEGDLSKRSSAQGLLLSVTYRLR